MKTLKITILLLVAAISLSTMTSCSKDNADNQDSIVGVWDVVEAEADAFVDGIAVRGIDVETTGTLSFSEDGTGTAAFSMTFAGETEAANGPFTWTRDGFELLITVGGETERYAFVADDSNTKQLQITYNNDDSNDEVEITFTMVRN